MRAFLLALQFLTRFPVNLSPHPDASEMGRSLLYYPLVGLLIGASLYLLSLLLDGQSTWLAAVLVLIFWVLASGALHLDGLADSADAWAGGHGDAERSLSIMKDPRSGPVAVVVLCLLLLFKLVSVQLLISQQQAWVLIVAPFIGRLSMLPLFLTTRYVNETGLGIEMANNLPPVAANRVILLCLLMIFVFVDFRMALFTLLMAAMLFYLLRRLMLKRLGGMTGDTAGAMIELMEAGVLLAAVLAG